MSKLLLSCDDYVYLHEGRYYAARQDNMDFYQRYLRVFDCLRLVTRCIVENTLKPGRVPLENEKRIEFWPIPEFHGPKQYAMEFINVGRALKGVTSGCDCAILRIPSTTAMRVGKQVMRNKLPYACEVVFDAEDGWKGAKGLNRFAWRIIDSKMRKMCNNANGVSCVTEHYMQKHYYSIKKRSFSSFYSSLDLPQSFFGSERMFPIHRPIVIAHIANQIQFKGRKGHNELIATLRLLQDRGIDVVIRFAGKDYLNGINELNRLIQDFNLENRVSFVGYLNREELDKFLNEADIFVLPTRAEGLPRVIIEAMAKGLPCITTPVSGNPELVDERFLVPYDDVALLADRIEELATTPNLYECTSRINYRRSKNYESSLLQARRDDFYNKLKESIS